MRRRRFLVHKVETRAYINVEHNANITTQHNLELLVSIRISDVTSTKTLKLSLKIRFTNNLVCYKYNHLSSPTS